MNLPKDFVDRMLLQLGQETFARFEAALSQPAPVSVRINRKKFDQDLVYEKTPWCSTGYYLPERPLFTSDPLWHAGAYYVQEASSMMIEQAFLKAKSMLTGSVKVLDLCAAPGGKSTHVASMLDTNDVLVSNEVIRSRVPVLYENLVKHGYPNIIITSADSSDFEGLGEIFDIILVDAPCSGEGLFRKDINAISEWSEVNVQTCELRQKRILDNIKTCLKPGGFLVYSTCTYNPGENEMQVDRLIGDGFELVPFELNGHVHHQFQCYPHETRGEGFYISLLQKQYTNGNDPKKPGNNKLKVLKTDHELAAFINATNDLYEYEDQVLYVPGEVMDFYRNHISNLYCYAIGTKVGRQKDKNYYPSEYLPFSQILKRNAMPEIELGQSEALSYLANNILPYQGKEKGYVLLTYLSVPLGLGKFAGNRINNLFPNEWKLRKQIDKDQWFNI